MKDYLAFSQQSVTLFESQIVVNPLSAAALRLSPTP